MIAWPSSPSSSSLQYARVPGSTFAIARGANPGRSTRRAPWWNGGADEVGRAAATGGVALEPVEQFVAVRAGTGFDLCDRAWREPREKHAAGAVVERRVGRDRRCDANGREFHRWAVVAHHHRARREVLGVVRDLGDVVV